MIRHLVVMHGWTDAEVFEGVRRHGDKLDQQHNAEHDEEHGAFDNDSTAHRDRSGRRNYHGQYHSH